MPVLAQIPGRAQVNPGLTSDGKTDEKSGTTPDPQAELELREGTALTHDGHFTEAIPHLKAARGRVADEYAANFNLALCYVATGTYKYAISVLDDLRRDGRDTTDVENLLAQAYIGSGQMSEAWVAVEQAAAKSPQNEKLYVFVSDACTDHQNFDLGLKVVELGLRNLPQSARLHYQRGMFLTQLDRFDQAKPDFELAEKLAPEGAIGFLSQAERSMLEGDIPHALGAAREGIAKGFQDPVLLTVLGASLLRSGVTPGQPEFAEAQSALERSVAERPNDAASQIALGEIYLHAGRLDDAITHLEKARQMKPNQPAVYANLAKAYQRHGDTQQAQQALAVLERLNLARADQIRNAPGERKMSYGGERRDQGH
jgi:predicted Zn-dependent protease